MSEKETLIRARLTELVAYRDENDKGLTQQAMADTLNTEGVPSLSGKPWSTYSIRHTLKKLGLSSSTKITRPAQTVSKASPPSTQPEKEVEHKLKDTSPLMQWNYYESIRGVVEDLVKKYDSNKSLAEKLNKMNVATADGSLWNEAAVSRALRVLQPTSAVQPSDVQTSDDLIRQQIKKGWYDTEEESFICVRKKLKKSSKRKAKGKSSKDVEQKKKKSKKNKKKKK
ncbi:MAG: hypothetical protein GY934_08380 [Gammaproteobacteria bacterium]|nr:hypothetical protein [Gammaproteobacteria bacterium]